MDDYLYDADTYLQSDAGIVKGKQGDSFQIAEHTICPDVIFEAAKIMRNMLPSSYRSPAGPGLTTLFPETF
jgi:hypothetical protein